MKHILLIIVILSLYQSAMARPADVDGKSPPPTLAEQAQIRELQEEASYIQSVMVVYAAFVSGTVKPGVVVAALDQDSQYAGDAFKLLSSQIKDDFANGRLTPSRFAELLSALYSKR